MKTIGIDASTTTAGISINENGIIINAYFLDLSKKESNEDKANLIINELNKIENIYKIVLESPLSSFSFGMTSQQTVIKLIRFNTILEYLLQKQFGKNKIFLINASTARKKVFGKSRIKGMKAKSFVKNELEKLMNLDKFKIKNKNNNDDKRMEDVYDAIVLSLN